MSGLSYLQVDKHGVTILYHLHLCRLPHDKIFRAKVGKGGVKKFLYYKSQLFPVSLEV